MRRLILNDQALRQELPGYQIRNFLPHMGKCLHGEIERACFHRNGNILFQLAWAGEAQDPEKDPIVWIQIKKDLILEISPPETFLRHDEKNGTIHLEHKNVQQKVTFYPRNIKKVHQVMLVDPK